MRKFLGIFLIIFGVITMTYPKIKEAYFDYQQRKLLETLTQSWEKLDEYDDIEQNPEEENLPIVGEN